MRAAVDVGESVSVAGADGAATAWWHDAGGTAAVIALGGVGNDPTGPAHVYPALAGRLLPEGIGTLRLEYRHAGHLAACVDDVLASIAFLAAREVQRVVVVGWSFGGAVAIASGAATDRISGVATIASQTFGADAVARLSPRPLLVVHGTGDQILPVALSERLFAAARDPRQLVLYDGDDHSIRRHSGDLMELLASWTVDVVG